VKYRNNEGNRMGNVGGEEVRIGVWMGHDRGWEIRIGWDMEEGKLGLDKVEDGRLGLDQVEHCGLARDIIRDRRLG